MSYRTIQKFLVCGLLTVLILAACATSGEDSVPTPTKAVAEKSTNETGIASSDTPPPTETPDPTDTPIPPTRTPKPTSSPTSSPTSLEEAFEEANHKINEGDFEGAIQVFSGFIEENPENAEAHRQRGLLFLDYTGQYDLAIDDFNFALELEPDHVETLVNRGNAYEYSGEPDTAITDYNRALEIDPQLAAGYHNRGLAYLKKFEYEQALQDFDKALELKPDYAHAYNSRCMLFRNEEQLDQALEDCDRAIEINPEFAMALFNRGYVYALKGELENALADLNESIELDPNYAPAFVMRGFAYGDLGEQQLAISDLKQAIALGLNPEEIASVEEVLISLTGDEVDSQTSQSSEVSESDEPSIGPLMFFTEESDNPADQFPLGTTAVYACFYYYNMTPEDRFTAYWYLNGKEIYNFSEPTGLQGSDSTCTGIGYGGTTIRKMDAGSYEVKIYIGNEFAQSGTFKIVQ
jgi:tetratricopeptide (TPR) repeat protein